MSRTAECLGLLPLVGRWTVDRLMVVYMNGVVSSSLVPRMMLTDIHFPLNLPAALKKEPLK